MLNGCSLMTDNVIDKCSKLLTNLQELDISSCLHVTDVGIQSITSFLSELRVLKLSWCAKVTDAGLLGTSCHGNNKSDLDWNSNTTSENNVERESSLRQNHSLTQVCLNDSVVLLFLNFQEFINVAKNISQHGCLNAGFKIAAGCQRKPAVSAPLPAIL
jgi:hypothetical protein